MMVPAGELRIFGNRSIDYARVIVEVGLSYEQDVDAILPVMEQVAQAWAEEHSGILLGEEPQIQALTQLGDSAVMARIVAKVVPGEQFEGERQLRKLLKRTFDEWGIEIPFPRRTIYMRQETAPPPRAAQPPPDA
jgi:small conductance mechanosensitive channel